MKRITEKIGEFISWFADTVWFNRIYTLLTVTCILMNVWLPLDMFNKMLATVNTLMYGMNFLSLFDLIQAQDRTIELYQKLMD